MLQKPIVYVSRITNLSDARYCAGMGVDMLGYVVDPNHDDYVSPTSYQEIVGWISGPKRVIEITSSKLDLHQLISEYLPDSIHIPWAIINRYDLPALPLILELPFKDWSAYRSQLQHLPRTITHLVITGLPMDTEILSPVPLNDPAILLTLGPDPGPLIPLMAKLNAHGFALHGSRELAPGLKDYEHLSQVLEELAG